MNVTQIAEPIQHLLTDVARRIGRESGFVRRCRKLDGASFVQTLVFGWMENPDASLEQLCQMALLCGVEISPQGLSERFTSVAAACLRQVLETALEQVVETQTGLSSALLARYTGVYVQDSTILPLPRELYPQWPGCGNQTGTSAGLKLQTVWELQRGRLEIQLHPASAHDNALQRMTFPANALRLADMGYFGAARLAQLTAQHVHWITRVPAYSVVCPTEGGAVRLSEWLAEHALDGGYDGDVLLSKKQLKCRLVAVQVSAGVADQRRQQMLDDAKRRGQTVSSAALALCQWTVVATNVPSRELSAAAVFSLLRVRWQIELLFKLWKSHGRLTRWRSQDPWRILCEVYGKLLMLVIQHWLLILGCGPIADRSLVKAANTLRLYVPLVLVALLKLDSLKEMLLKLAAALRRCRLNKRKTRPATFQLLASAPSLDAYGARYIAPAKPQA